MQDRKTRTEATRLPSDLLAMAGKTGLLSPQSSPWRANHAPCDTMLAVASSFARRGGQTWLSVTMLLASRASLLAVASTDSWLSRNSHSSSQNPNFEPLHPKFSFQSLLKHFQTLKELQNHMKFEPKHLSIQKPHLTHFCKPHKNTPIP